LDKGPDVKKKKEGKAEIQKSNPQNQDEEDIRKRLAKLGYI